MSSMTVQFPDGPREVPAIIMGRQPLGSNQPSVRIPRMQHGVRFFRDQKGWVGLDEEKV